MNTHLEPDILKYEVKWALGSITTNKASGDDGIPVELFQILRDDAVKVLHSICKQIWKTQHWPGLEKVSFHSSPKEKPCQGIFKLPYDPAILLLGIYHEEIIIEKDTCTPVFIAALFTISRTWKQPRFPLTDERVEKLSCGTCT